MGGQKYGKWFQKNNYLMYNLSLFEPAIFTHNLPPILSGVDSMNPERILRELIVKDMLF